MTLLDPVRRALAARDDAVVVFFRDDDIGWAPLALERLLETFGARDVPRDLAVIPAAQDEAGARGLRTKLRCGRRFGLHQHGHTHENHEGNNRKCEFGPRRTRAAQHADIASGQAWLRTLFGADLDPIFTPPWNRCTQDTADVLSEAGFSALSRDATARPLELRGLCDLSVAVDWMKAPWPGAEHARLAHCMQQVGARLRSGGHCGIMLHHAVMTAADLDALDALLVLLRRHPRVELRLMRELLG
ncbi:MAG: hypothetical protein RLW62_18230 [Gammaproteobacteria bacterium]